MKSRLRWLALAAPLLYLPLRAAESPPPEPETADEAEAPEAPAESAPAGRTRAPEQEAPPEAAGGERLSLDNNISFPVDI